MRLQTMALVALSIVSGTACAESQTKNSRFDARIKDVVYNPADVVKVVGHYGYSTDIEFGPGETTENIALGDSVAWEVAPAANHLFVKPSEDNAVTNMTVVTNRHVYQISLDARNSHGRTSGSSKDMYFQVRFTYPDDGHEGVGRLNEQRVQTALGKLPDARNWNYYGCGAKDMQPSEVFDDGRFTYMRFPASQEIPAVFMVGTDNAESIVNGSMHGDYYVVQRTAQRFVLRRGKSVACVQNRSFNRFGVGTPTGTVSPDVTRLVNSDSADTPADVPNASVSLPTTSSNGTGARSQPLPLPLGPDGQPQLDMKTSTDNRAAGKAQ